MAVAGARRHRVLRHPAQYVVAAFVAASVAGAVLLWIPAASTQPGSTSFLTALFTATSAVCVTGLVVVDTGAHWSPLGEGIILGLIQVGGFGIMTMTSLIVLVLARRLGLRQRLIAVAEARASDLNDVRRILIGIARFSIAVEATAAVLLFVRFWAGHGEPFGRAVYLSVFHAVSAFNNAGFDLFGNSLMGFASDPFLMMVVAVTVIIGGLGFPVWVQIWRCPRTPRRWSLHAKLTVTTTLVLLVGGFLLFAWFEWTNARTLGPMSAVDSVVNSFVHSVMPRTAGFNSVDVAGLREPSRLLTEILMFIGGGSASTAGGIKVSTFALLGFVIWAELRGDPEVVLFRRRVSGIVQRQALTVALLAVGAMVASTMLVLATSGFERGDVLFEVVSALGTVGLSTGITPALDSGARLVLIGLMILGRVGPPTLFAALVLRERNLFYRFPYERPIIG